MEDAIKALLAFVGLVFGAGGGIAVIAYGLLRFFGEKWMNARFDQRLAAFKHAQEKELEELRYKISALMDRTVKLHQREFDVIPEAWGKLTDAYGIVTAIISSLQQYPDLDRASGPELEEFLENASLANWQKDDIRSTDKRTKYYIKVVTLQKISQAKEACRDFHIYFKRHGIFVPEPIKVQFLELDQLIYGALIEHEINERDELRPRLRESQKKLPQVEVMMAALERDVQGRLWGRSKSQGAQSEG
jgi:hypothetical protein